MRFQRAHYTCGPASLVNAATALGLSVSEYHVEELCSTTERSGTNEHGMFNAAKAIGLQAQQFEFNSPEAAWFWLVGCMGGGIPVILCVEKWEHYVVAVGRLGDSIIVIDSQQEYSNMIENGIKVMPRTKFLEYWRYQEEARERYWGIALTLRS